jgi:enoyl-CoA hydratase/carnithine racemase
MADQFVRSEVGDDGVALVTLDRPELNALSIELLDQLGEAAHALGASDVKAVVLTGAGRSFAAGADISEFETPEAARVVTDRFRRTCDALTAIHRPVIAAVNGFALGGGLELTLACDLRIAADDARLGQPEILLGIMPGGGGTQRLARLVGPARAKEIVWSGRHLGAPEAIAIGLVDRVVPADELVETALGWARDLACGAVVAMGVAKRVIDAGLDTTLSDGLDLESDGFVETFSTEDAATGIASFLEHGPGKASFRGR